VSATDSQPSPNTHLGLPEPIRACLFDLDGVLVRTAQLHEKAWAVAFDEFLSATADGHGYEPFSTDDFEKYVNGRLRADGAREFLRSRHVVLPDGTDADESGARTVQGLSKRKNDVLRELIRTEGAAAYPGSVEYLHAVRAAGLHVAVVSSSRNADAVLAAAGLTQLLDATLTGAFAADHGLAGKPAPDTFLAGADAVGVPPEAAAVFEDAPAGVAAGRAGRFGFVVGVDRVGQADELAREGADVVVTDLAELLR
jgi:beta-phosphoglucomutase family hydrolase